MPNKEIKSLTYKGYDVQNDKTYQPFLGKKKVVAGSAVELQLKIMSLKREIQNDEKKLAEEIKNLLNKSITQKKYNQLLEQSNEQPEALRLNILIKKVLELLIRVASKSKNHFVSKAKAGLDEGLPTDQGQKIIDNDNIVLIALQSALRGNTAYTFLKSGQIVGAHSGAIPNNKGTRQQGEAHDIRRELNDINNSTAPEEIINKFTAMYLESLAHGELIESDNISEEHKKLSENSKGSNKKYLTSYKAVNTLINENNVIDVKKLASDMHMRREIMKHRLSEFCEDMNKIKSQNNNLPQLRRRNSVSRLQPLTPDNNISNYAYNPQPENKSTNSDLSAINTSDTRTQDQKREDFLKIGVEKTTEIAQISLPNDNINDNELKVMSLTMNVAGYISQPMRMDFPELVEEYKKILNTAKQSKVRKREELDSNESEYIAKKQKK